VIAAILTTVAGLVLLGVAADRLVLSAGRLARRWGLSPILIGAVVIGLGTSIPELFVSALAATRAGGLDLAVGNIVGSNIANLSLVLGLSVLLSPIVGHGDVLKREGPLMLIGSALFAGFAWDNRLTLAEGVFLTVALVGALVLIVAWSTKLSDQVGGQVEEVAEPGETRVLFDLAVGLGSLGVLLLGGQLLVTGASAIAVDFGVSGAVIGLTVVAVGTSLPELATVAAAARRRENDLVLGNVLGSNLFNALGVGGVAAIVGDQPFLGDLRGPLLAMMVVSVFVAVLAVVGRDRISRPAGLIFLAGYPLMLVYM
jgi:cation:H+ antiporter